MLTDPHLQPDHPEEKVSSTGCGCSKVTKGISRWKACCLAVGGCAYILCIQPGTAEAAPSGSTIQTPAPINIQPPTLLQQVELQYPEAALSSGQHGDVSVLVDVDASGRVIGTRFESGPEVFRNVSLDTAARLDFAPATADGVPVAATTRVSFHFAPPGSGYHAKDHASHAEMVIHSTNPDHKDTRARTTLEEEDLEKSAGDDLAKTISQIAGVRIAGGTADASKPIIRGQQERRLLVLNDGVRHESQKWGSDHATEIDPFSAGSISVIRGAAGARYGPDAIGGVILVEPPAMRTDPGIAGKILTSYNTNGRRPYAALRVDAGSESGVSTRVEGNATIGATRAAPDYLLGNTASKTWNLGGAMAYDWDGGNVRASWHHHDFKAGVFYGLNHGTPDEFLAQFETDRPVTADVWESSYEIGRPYQEVTHDIGILRTEMDGDWGSIEAIYAFQINLRKEFEHARRDITGPQYDFTLRTHSIDTLYGHPTASFGKGELEGGAGIQGGFQENVYRGWSLIPNFRSFSGGVFAYERLSLKRVDIEAGARADTLTRAAYLRDNDYDAHVRRGTLDTNTCEERDQTARCPADYSATSFSLGTLVHVIPELIDLKLDLSTATRFPNVDELYMLGSAPTFPVYANGHPDLGTETVWNGSFTAGLRTEAIETEASVYGQLVDDYVYFAPELNDSGDPRYDVTIRGTWPSWGYQPVDAKFYGLDGSVNLGPNSPVGLKAVGGLVRAEDRATGDHLIGTPADHLHLELVGRIPPTGTMQKVELHVSTELVASQSRVESSHDFAPPPPGYTLLGAGIDTEFGRRQPVRVGVDAHNLLNTAYREYSSLLRYYADQPGRDVRVRVGMDF
jgi:iron complex outermembrane receptor protein